MTAVDHVSAEQDKIEILYTLNFQKHQASLIEIVQEQLKIPSDILKSMAIAVNVDHLLGATYKLWQREQHHPMQKRGRY